MKDTLVLVYNAIAIFLNLLPTNINAILLSISLIGGIILLSGRIYKVYQENRILYKKRNLDNKKGENI